jgi:uncharacterized protein (TIGR02646 family)
MRWIRENEPPEALIRCLALRRQSGQSLNYDEVSVKKEIRKSRIADQGGICAYTMMRIDENSCHNEHLIPRAVSRESGNIEQTLDYKNIVACFPKEVGAGGIEYGAHARGTKNLVFTPLDQSCEERIHYKRATGKAEPTKDGDDAATELINDVLKLNHKTLIENRLNAFNQAGVGNRSSKPLTGKQARRLASLILTYKKGGDLTPYCVALSHAATQHAEWIEHLRKRRST